MCCRVSFINEQKIINILNANLPTAIYTVSLDWISKEHFCAAVLLLQLNLNNQIYFVCGEKLFKRLFALCDWRLYS